MRGIPFLKIAGSALAVFVGYYLGAKLGFALTFHPHPVSVLWPPNAILLAALLLSPTRTWWILLLAAFSAHWLAQMQSDVPPRMILGWFVSNSCEALIGAGSIRYLLGRLVQLDRLRNVAIFCLFAAFVGPFLSTFLDSAFVAMNHWGRGSYWEISRIRFTSNVLAELTVAALVVSWATGGFACLRSLSGRRLLEGICLLAALITISFFLFNGIVAGTDSALLYVPLPFLLWAAVRFGSCGATAASSAVAFPAILSVAQGHGPFSERSAEENALSVQVFLIFLSVPLLFLAAIIEERDQAEDALREREMLNRGVIDSLTSLMAILDPSGGIIAINESWRKAYLAGDVELAKVSVGANYLDVCREVARSGDASAGRVVAGIEGVLGGTENHFECEYECTTPAGSLWFEMLVLRLRTRNGGAVIKHRDITRHKAAQKALRQRDERINLAAESANLALWTIDFEHRASWMSEKGREIFGFSPNEPLSREIFLCRVHPEDRERVDKAIEEARVGSQGFEIEYRLVRPDTETRWLIARGRYLRNEKGELSELLGVAIDVTSQIKADLALGLQREEMARLNRMASMGELTASLAHELNQPLTAIASNAAAGKRFLERGTPDLQMFEELLDDIFTDARRAGDIIHGIHHLVRKGERQRKLVNPNDIIVDVLRLLHSDLLGRATTVETSLASNLPSLQADPVHLQQALLNLIMNSLEAMNDRLERRILISTMSAEEFVEVSVRDYGMGLPEESPDKIFTQFFSTKPNGMGMGLTIVRSIVEEHGGELGAENLGDGARVFFRLPLL